MKKKCRSCKEYRNLDYEFENYEDKICLFCKEDNFHDYLLMKKEIKIKDEKY